MDLQTAKNRAASALAYRTFRAVEDLKTLPSLAENTEFTKRNNRDAAAALGLTAEYSRSCHILGIGAHA